MLYLALGATPVRYVLMSKRLNYLKYIINEDDGTMLKECFKAQHQEPTKGDWVTTVLADMEHLNINMTFDEIKNVSVNSFKNIVKKQIKIKALEYLQQCQQSHSKSKHVIYHKLEMDEYLKSGNNLTIQEKQFIFKARTHMLNARCNFKTGLSNINCRHGCSELEEQVHILQCSSISDNQVSSLNTPDYCELFGHDVKKISTVGRILMTRSKIFFQDKPSAQDTGATAANQVQTSLSIN